MENLLAQKLHLKIVGQQVKLISCSSKTNLFYGNPIFTTNGCMKRYLYMFTEFLLDD